MREIISAFPPPDVKHDFMQYFGALFEFLGHALFKLDWQNMDILHDNKIRNWKGKVASCTVVVKNTKASDK